MIHALNRIGRLGPGARVVLIHSTTFGGKAAVTLLEHILPCCFDVRVNVQEVPDLNVDDSSGLRRSLAEFMSLTATELERGGSPDVTCFAPVGGYKVMTSLGYLAGAYLGYPTAYLHEDNQALHEIPAVPIQVSRDKLEKAAPLMKKINECYSWQGLSKKERIRCSEMPFLFVREDDTIGVTSFGIFLMKRSEYRNLFGTQLYVARSEARRLQQIGAKSTVISRIFELRRKIDDYTSNQGELRHDLVFDRLKDAFFWLYKGPHGTIHAAYSYDKDSDILYVSKVWIQHDDYETDANRGRGFFKPIDEIEWENWTDELSNVG